MMNRSSSLYSGKFHSGNAYSGAARLRCFVLILCASTMLAPLAWAQVALEVTLIDPARKGPAEAGVTVKLDNRARGITLSANSDAQGKVRFGGLESGPGWRVTTIGNAHFLSADSGPLSLRSVTDRSITLVLQPAWGAEDAGNPTLLTVTAARNFSRFNNINAEVSGTLSIDDIHEIPVEARNLERVLFRLPGVTQATGFFGEAPAVAINGANSLFTNFTVDGLDNNENFLGGQKFPIPVGAIDEVSVLSGSYSVEYGRTANGVVNVSSKSGSNDLTGEVFFLTRPGGFLSGEPASGSLTTLFGAPVTDNFRRFQGGFGIGGPIVKDRTFFFLNAEFSADQTNNILSSPLLTAPATIAGTNRQTLLSARIDQNWSDAWHSSLRINHGRVRLQRPGGGLTGGNGFPSAGSVQDRLSTLVALTTDYSKNNLDYAVSLQYSRFDWNFGRPLVPAGPQVSLFGPSGLNIATLGSPGFVFDETENTGQLQQKLTIKLDRHKVKIGSDFINARYRLFGGGNVNGNFNVSLTQAQIDALRSSNIGAALNVGDLPANVRINSAFFETQPNAFGDTQRIYSFFVEDQYQATPDLSLTLGLRYDFDSLTNVVGHGDFNNIGPRAALNWTPRPDLSVRAGIGLFHEKIPYAIISDAIQQNSTSPGFLGQLSQLIAQGILPADADLGRLTTNRGNITVDATGRCTSLSQCPSAAELAALRNNVTFNGDRRIFNPNGLDNPEAIQASLGVQWQVHTNWLFGIDGQYNRGRNLLRLVDLNAPDPFVFAGTVRSVAAANATRPAVNPDGTLPLGGARSIIVSDSGGRSRYTALIFKIQKSRGQDFYDSSIFYTLSRLNNDTDDINVRANDANNFGADFGPSLNDRTHVVSAIFNLYPVRNLTFTLAGLFQSGQPINFVPDAALFGTTDLNGDGLSFADQFTGNPDRAPGLSRNSGRLPWSRNVDIGLSYRIEALSPAGASGGHDDKRGVELRVDFFNIFNANNASGYPVNFTASNQIQIVGQPFNQRSAAPPRSFQAQIRYLF